MNTKAILLPRLRIGVENFVGSLNQYLYHSVAVVHTGVKARNCMWLFDDDGYQAISTDIDEMGPFNASGACGRRFKSGRPDQSK